MRKTVAVILALFALIGSNAASGATGPVVTRTANKPNQPRIVQLPAAHNGVLVPRANGGDAGLVKIFNNFTQYKNSPYWGWSGYAVLGPDAGGEAGAEQWLAAPFTPTADHIATKVELAGLHYSGGNTFFVSINSDASGLPGKALHTFQLKNLLSVACCEVDSVLDKTGVKLQGGKQYWIVFGTNANDTNAGAIWGFSEFASVQRYGANMAIYCVGNGCGQLGYKDNAWNPEANLLYGLAFAVLGT
jgi:hypothetical protein